jgi:deazaflavin-dependent oxidoreductase (nitroreductase family)
MRQRPPTIDLDMANFTDDVLKAAAKEREVTLTTYGRKTGKPHEVTIWLSTDGQRLYIRSGQGLGRQWPQNFLARGEAVLRLGKQAVKVKPQLVTDPSQARATSDLYTKKYGLPVKASEPDQPLTPGEQATFELIPAA